MDPMGRVRDPNRERAIATNCDATAKASLRIERQPRSAHTDSRSLEGDSGDLDGATRLGSSV
jgi:hypothetical protein